MTRLEQACWEQNIQAVYAEEVLRERGGSLSAEELRSVVQAATGDAVLAEEEFARRWLEEHRSGG